MRGFQIVAFFLGALLLGLGLAAGLTGAVSAFVVRDGAAAGLIDCLIVASFVGGLLFLIGIGAERRIDFRSAVALTVSAWTIAPLITAIPFLAEPLDLRLSDAVFESVSGITTTGSTVLTGLDETAPSLLFWRALLQWIGGIGIIGLSIAILPFLKVGGMQLFQMESSDQSKDRLIARPTNLALLIAGLYLGLTLTCAAAYRVTGMSVFEAVTHAMTTVSTGGFSTSDSSMGAFGPGAAWVAIIFMAAGAAPFLAYVRLVNRNESRRPGAFEEVLGLIAVIAGFGALLFIAASSAPEPVEAALREALFAAVSVVTTTGYATSDYQAWGPLALAAIFFLTFVGGCAGSTAGGFKIFRIQIILKSVWRSLRQASWPHGVFVARHAGRALSNVDIASVALFAGLYVGCFAVGTIGLALFGLDFMTAVTGAATALANVGPGLGDVIGPAGNFAALPDGAKWLLVFLMILGRLEITAIIVLITPTFWDP